MSKVSLKISKRHPTGAFKLGRHVVTYDLKEFDLNESEEKELKSDGCQAWLTEEKKAPAKKKKKED